eukprot:CAMPEP_0180032386 /NCGR_PEP_ID=MMETSP0984-20121128/28432_1 /TAXON_ID=483367 /ORGANISM="non described non described, Strain CCMP 2436" /LENGTH=56 /DNA_ID=CAMNT_0021957623 /DNA_START=28 /DNA_END=199 /DNA_ORIENTATION=+
MLLRDKVTAGADAGACEHQQGRRGLGREDGVEELELAHAAAAPPSSSAPGRACLHE